MTLDPLRLEADRVLLLDQTLLPGEEKWIGIPDAEAMAAAIARWVEAPAVGIAAAGAGGRGITRRPGASGWRAGEGQAAPRRVAPNGGQPARAVDRVPAAARARFPKGGERKNSPTADTVRAEALAIWEEDRAASRAMAALASLFLGDGFVTHCNTGGLATGGGGTALAVLLKLHELRANGIEVWATETRPLLQGARLTAWELLRARVPVRLIVDSAAAHTILREGIQGVLVGADRIARNGDTANKIGTLGLALAAREAGVPFVVVAPSSTIDPATPDGSTIDREQDAPKSFGSAEFPSPQN